MNYYDPYFYTMPNVAMNGARTGLFSRLFGGLSLGKVLNGTERALNFANQAIPLVKQVKPMIGNAKTMFKVMNEFKRQEKPSYNYSTNISNQNNYESKNNNQNTNEPTFFL